MPCESRSLHGAPTLAARSQLARMLGHGGELAGRQALQVEIGLDLAVKLLMGGMRLVALDHRLQRPRPGWSTSLPTHSPVRAATGHRDRRSRSTRRITRWMTYSVLLSSWIETACVPGAWRMSRTQLFPVVRRHRQPGISISRGRAARVPFDDIVEPAPSSAKTWRCCSAPGAPGCRSRCPRVTDRLLGQALGARQYPLQKGVALLHGVLLASRSSRPRHHPVAQVGGDRGVAIDLLVGPRDAFLLRVAVVHDEGVDVQADVRRLGGDRCFDQ